MNIMTVRFTIAIFVLFMVTFLFSAGRKYPVISRIRRSIRAQVGDKVFIAVRISIDRIVQSDLLADFEKSPFIASIDVDQGVAVVCVAEYRIGNITFTPDARGNNGAVTIQFDHISNTPYRPLYDSGSNPVHSEKKASNLSSFSYLPLRLELKTMYILGDNQVLFPHISVAGRYDFFDEFQHVFLLNSSEFLASYTRFVRRSVDNGVKM